MTAVSGRPISSEPSASSLRPDSIGLLLGAVGGLVLRGVRPQTVALVGRDDAGVELPE